MKYERVNPNEWQIQLGRNEDGVTWFRLQYRERTRDFYLRPGDTLDLQVTDGQIIFKGHKPAPPPPRPFPVRVENLYDLPTLVRAPNDE